MATYTYCSFANDRGFLGLVILRGLHDSGEAATACSQLGLHPGGEMMVLPVPEAAPLQPEEWQRLEDNCHRLLSEEEARKLFNGKSLGELTADEKATVQRNAAIGAAERDCERIEECSFALFEAFADLAALMGLDRVQRHAVVELLHYTTNGAAGREFTVEEKAQLESLKQRLFERAEKHYAENKAARATAVNTTGGQA